MNRKRQIITLCLALAVFSLLGGQGTFAQHDHDSGAKWRTGMLRLSNPAWAGNVRLKSGMYHVKHVVAKDKHWLIFKTVNLRAGYREGSMWEGREITRLECSVQAVAKSARNTRVTFIRTSNNVTTIKSVQVAGEKVKHILLPPII